MDLLLNKHTKNQKLNVLKGILLRRNKMCKNNKIIFVPFIIIKY